MNLSSERLPASLLGMLRYFEGCRLHVYRDVVGVPTIGYRHTGPEVHIGMPPITKEEAEALLIKDAEKHLRAVFKLIHASDNRIAALDDFAFNLGIGRYKNSTLRKRVEKNNWHTAAQEIQK